MAPEELLLVVRISEDVGTIRAEIAELKVDVSDLRKQVLVGNGQPPLLARVRAIEQTCASRRGHESGERAATARSKISWQAVATIVVSVITAAGAVLVAVLS